MKWTRLGMTLAAATVVTFLAVLTPASAQQPATYQLKNGWKGTFLSVNGTAIVQSPTAGPAASWLIEPAQGAMRLRSAVTGGYLTLRGGVVQAVPLASDAQNALWAVEPTNNNQYARLRNLGQPNAYLNIETGPVQAGAVQPGWLSAFWQAAPYQNSVASAPQPQQPQPPANRPPVAAGMVTMDILNQSAAPLDIFVDDRAGNVAYVSTIPPGYGVVQQSPVGYVWWLAQQDQWMGGYQAGTEAQQLIAFPPT